MRAGRPPCRAQEPRWMWSDGAMPPPSLTAAPRPEPNPYLTGMNGDMGQALPQLNSTGSRRSLNSVTVSLAEDGSPPHGPSDRPHALHVLTHSPASGGWHASDLVQMRPSLYKQTPKGTQPRWLFRGSGSRHTRSSSLTELVMFPTCWFPDQEGSHHLDQVLPPTQFPWAKLQPGRHLWLPRPPCVQFQQEARPARAPKRDVSSGNFPSPSPPAPGLKTPTFLAVVGAEPSVCPTARPWGSGPLPWCPIPAEQLFFNAPPNLRNQELEGGMQQ